MTNKNTHFFVDKPVFGMDVGHGSLKVMQLKTGLKGASIVGYGTTYFDMAAMKDGVITNQKVVAKAVYGLFKNGLIGEINTRRVALAIPAYRTFSRSIQLPKMSDKDLMEAVQLEVEQYIPVPLADLYLDFMVTGRPTETNELLVVAVPKKIVDSYLQLTDLLGLEPVLIEPTTTAGSRFFSRDKHNDMTSVLIDFGSQTASISLFDKTTLATSTVPAGGLVFTQAIASKLGLSEKEAGLIKTKYGLGVSKFQKDVSAALEPALQKIVTEVKRMIRYHEERYGGKSGVAQVVMLGGGANMPGLANYLTDALKIPTRTLDHPWNIFESKGLRAPAEPDRLMYATVAGLSLVNSEEVFKT